MENGSTPNWLKQRAFLTPNRIALISSIKQYTFQELWERTKSIAGKIKTATLHAESWCMGLLIKNTEQSVLLIHALQQLGISAVLLNNKLSAKELDFQLNDMGLKMVIYDESFQGKINELASWNSNVNMLSISTLQTFNETPFEQIETFSFEKVCSVMYTSGTTGKPKGVLQTYGNHWWSAIGSSLNLGLHEKDMWLCAVPLFHISGYSILMKSVIYGMPVRLYESFDVSEINYELKQGKVTIMSVVTNMLNRMMNELRAGDSYHENFRCMLLGGGPAPLPLLETCKERNIPVFQTYGMTETSSQIVTLSPEYSISKLGSAGKPLFPAEIKIMKNNKRALPYEEGEIYVKGPNVTKGYYKREEANENSFVGEWFQTGDIGYVDEEGFLFMLDRRSDLIISGGENVYPAQIEETLLSYPTVMDVGVVGIPSSKWGEVPCAFVVTKQKNVSEEELLLHCRQHLASYKTPKKFIFVDELPRNASNKLLRRVLKDWWKKELNQE
ncbi:o-succinylbenzoate--CoA ligase [Bacillus seohaeanensis]|jgi:o-succinylbenzoate---CoA ligase|uniref:2-succinylbenzoate--CoA ligase n=1 Tax=Bacillus seohaeanensis TaxID=284580 RepID=A0ABW5RTB7_9BACI